MMGESIHQIWVNVSLSLPLFQLIVGSEDYDLRVFKEDEIIAEMTETEVSFTTQVYKTLFQVQENLIFANICKVFLQIFAK